jgi:hypothetical protein
VFPARIHQELAPVAGNSHAEMIGDRFMPTHSLRQAEGGSEIDSLLPLAALVSVGWPEGCDRAHGLSCSRL